MPGLDQTGLEGRTSLGRDWGALCLVWQDWARTGSMGDQFLTRRVLCAGVRRTLNGPDRRRLWKNNSQRQTLGFGLRGSFALLVFCCEAAETERSDDPRKLVGPGRASVGFAKGMLTSESGGGAGPSRPLFSNLVLWCGPSAQFSDFHWSRSPHPSSVPRATHRQHIGQIGGQTGNGPLTV